MNKIIFLASLLFLNLASAALQVNCLLTERYNDQKIETPVKVEIENGVAFFQKATTRNSQIQFAVYYSAEIGSLGVRVNDNELGISSSSYIDPSQEKGFAKVRHIRTKPEAQLFAVDCSMKN